MAESDFSEGKRSVHLEGLELPIKYLPKERDEPFKEGTLTSLGEAGLMMALKESLTLGTELHLRLQLPKPLISDSEWQTVPIDAKVVWIDDFSRPDELRRYGTQFMEMPEQDMRVLKQYLQLTQWMKDKIRNQ